MRLNCEICGIKFAVLSILYDNNNGYIHKAIFVCIECYYSYVKETKHKVYPYLTN